MGFFMDDENQIICHAKIENNVLIINSSCLEHDMYPSLDPEQALDLIRDKIDMIDKVYDINNSSIDFSGSLLSSSSIKTLDFYKAFYSQKS